MAVTDQASLRKQRSEKILKLNNVTISPGLQGIDTEDAELRDVEEICRKLKADYLCALVAVSYQETPDEELKNQCRALIEGIDAVDLLDEAEYSLLYGEGGEEAAEIVEWNMESIYSLLWAIGVCSDEEMHNPYYQVGRKEFELYSEVIGAQKTSDIIASAKLRSLDEILDMQDLYMRYHWAFDEREGNHKVKVGKLNADAVMERHKALEWLLSREEVEVEEEDED